MRIKTAPQELLTNVELAIVIVESFNATVSAGTRQGEWAFESNIECLQIRVA
jgi:hypothetical protein